MKVSVDTEKLAWGLEEGVSRSRTGFGSLPRETILRVTPCGIVSSAISEYLKKQEIPHQLIVSEPDLLFDPDMRHVFALVGNDPEHSKVIDASYSQFLWYVGLRPDHKEHIGVSFYPDKKVIDFKLAEPAREIEQIVDWAEAFQKFNQETPGRWGHFSDGPLENASRAAIFSAFTEIWGNPDNLSPWKPSQRVINDGLVVSEGIPNGAITVS